MKGHKTTRSAPTAQPTAPRLTPRERDVVALVCDGLPQRAVAARLGVRTDTVRDHVRNIARRIPGVELTHGGATRALRRVFAPQDSTRALADGVGCPRCDCRPALRVAPALAYLAGELAPEVPVLSYACHAVYCGHVYTITAGQLQPSAAAAPGASLASSRGVPQ
jgi:DNA-binding CsgD family transcriptional regulator